MAEYKFAYICPKCEKYILFFNTKPKYGELIKAENFYFEDGTQPESGERIACPKCGEFLGTLYDRYVVEL